jgi:4-azaleucine resistance transporter AzlC
MSEPRTPSKPGWHAGLQAAVPIAVGYLPIAVTFGLLARAAGIPDIMAILMSILVFAGASQFISVNLLMLGTNPWEIVLTTFILNSRHFLMSAALSQRIAAGTSRRWLPVVGFGITDETFTVASLRQEKELSPNFLLALNFLSYFSWLAGTGVGVFLAGGLPATLQASMGIALFALFIGLLVPSIRASRQVLVVVAVAAGIHSLLYYTPALHTISAGWKIILATIGAALAASLILPGGAVKS